MRDKEISKKWMVCFSRVYLILFLCGGFVHAQENWVYQYNGFGYGVDYASSIVIGLDGNIYAAGYSTAANYALTVISLSTAGDENWVYRSGGWHWASGAFAIDYGADGNIYAAGWDAGNFYDESIFVVSIDTTGNERWSYTRAVPWGDAECAYSIVCGLDGNIYVAGYDYNSDFIVISLDTAGSERWFYTSGYGGVNVAFSVTFGLDGNIYAAGETGWGEGHFTVISLDTAGSERWVYQYSGHGGAYSLVYGLDGNIYATGYSTVDSRDFTVVSIDTAGNERWAYTYDGPASDRDEANAVVYGNDGDIYVAGIVTGSYTDMDFAVISLDTAGSERWVYTYDASANAPDDAFSIACGADGNIYAAGYSTGEETNADFTVVSLTNTGDENWVYKYYGYSDNSDEANSIVCGTDGNIYAAGYVTGGATNADFTVISLQAVGVEENFDSSSLPIILYQNKPNPFRRKKGTTISYILFDKTDVNLSIYNNLGQCVRTLVKAIHGEGTYKIFWNGRNDSGEELASGVYFCTINTPEFSETIKLLLIE